MEHKGYKRGHFIALGIPLGMPLGIGIGILLEKITIGIAIGPAIGVAIGCLLEALFNRKPLAEQPAESRAQKAVLVTLLGLGILVFVGALAFLLQRQG